MVKSYNSNKKYTSEEIVFSKIGIINFLCSQPFDWRNDFYTHHASTVDDT